MTFDIGSNLTFLVLLWGFFKFAVPIIFAVVVVIAAFVAWHRLTKPDPYHKRPKLPKQLGVLIVFMIALVALVVAGAL
jgi:hypothetical protein